MKPFQAKGIVTRIASRADGGLSIAFATQEMSNTDKAAALEYHNSYGFVLFKPNEFKDEDIPASDASDKTKSPSQRLRSTLFVYWKQKEGPKPDFDVFYRQEMETFINVIKNMLV